MPSHSTDPDVLVLGGGPAGCSAARLLALWGHRVTLVTRDEGSALAESLTPSCQKFFDLLGIGPDVDRAAFVRSTGNTVWWGRDARVEPFRDGARGWQVSAAALGRVLLKSARDAGVAVEMRAITAEEAAARPAVYRLDCTGRTGLIAKARSGRRHEPGHRTVALTSIWRRARWGLQDSTHTLIESYEDGWAWSVPLDDERRAVAVMVDPRSTAMTRGGGARPAYLAEIGKTRHLAALLDPATMLDGPAGWDASMYRSTTFAGDDWLLTGDAASFIDPLSSSGVKKALASGWLAAVAVHTALVRPSMAATAVTFYAAREADVYARFLSLTRRHLAGAAQASPHPFWSDRASAEGTDETGVGATETASQRAAVLTAYERIRRASELIVQLADGVETAMRPAIGGNEIVLEPRVVTAPDEPGVRFVNDVDVVTLLALAPVYRSVPDLHDACARRSGPVDVRSFLTALSTAVARGWLVMEDT